jgi:hypothetical protein
MNLAKKSNIVVRTKEGVMIPFGKKKILAKLKPILVKDIMFDSENPRISLAVDSHVVEKNMAPTQELVEYILRSMPGYDKLKESIKEGGGALNPIWVIEEDNKYVVVEGNTRLRIYLDLQVEDPDEFSYINCFIFPKGLSYHEKDYIRLVSHLRGTNEWDAYERAKYLYKLSENELYPISELTKVTKLSQSEIKSDLEAYKLMDSQFKKIYKNQPNLIYKFSYFKEYFKNSKLKSKMKELKYSDLDFCKWVAKDKIPRAIDVRELPTVLSETESRKMFIDKGLEQARELIKKLSPEKSEKIFIEMKDLTERIKKLPFSEIQEIRELKSKNKVAKELCVELEKVLEG